MFTETRTTEESEQNARVSAEWCTNSAFLGEWMENMLVDFDLTNGFTPSADLIIDASGNLYGTTTGGGQHEFGEVFKLAPSGGGFTYSSLYAFDRTAILKWCNHPAGNLFGTCYDGGAH